jgi:mannose-6-phosphate isomerase-like protein (cupin superfamily)
MSKTMTPKLGNKASYRISEAIVVEDFVMPQLPSDMSSFGASRFSVPIGERTPVDVHASREFWLIRSGFGELLYAGDTFEVEAGDVVYFEPQHTHSIYNNGDRELEIFSVWRN